MGEIADLMLDGILCEQCGVYIGEAIGYTRNCQNCQPKRRHNSRKKSFANHVEQASSWNGIVNYLKINYNIDCYKKGNQKRTKKLLQRYLTAKKLAKKEGNSHQATWYNAYVIQMNFQAFVEWLKKQDLSHF